jgi:hypothetical protein
MGTAPQGGDPEVSLGLDERQESTLTCYQAIGGTSFGNRRIACMALKG